jgi:hypothetical protein
MSNNNFDIYVSQNGYGTNTYVSNGFGGYVLPDWPMTIQEVFQVPIPVIPVPVPISFHMQSDQSEHTQSEHTQSEHTQSDPSEESSIEESSIEESSEEEQREAGPREAGPREAGPREAGPREAGPREAEPTALIEAISETLKTFKKGKDIILPINKILNIGVEVSIYKQTKQIYRINIEPTDFEVEENTLFEEVYDRELTKEPTEDAFIQNVVKSILSHLKTIKINKISGRFSANNKQKYVEKVGDLWSMFCHEFKEIESVTLSFDECCVCYSFTKTMTNCDHSVCLECISKIRNETEVDQEFNTRDDYKNCPMCRQRITRLHNK